MKFYLLLVALGSVISFNLQADQSCLANIRLANPGPDYKWVCVDGSPTKVLINEVQPQPELPGISDQPAKPDQIIGGNHPKYSCMIGVKLANPGPDHKWVCVDGKPKRVLKNNSEEQQESAESNLESKMPCKYRAAKKNKQAKLNNKSYRYVCVRGKLRKVHK